MLEVKKQGSNANGVWVIGTLNLNGLVIDSIFNTNLKEVIADTSKPIQVKKVKISNKYNDKTNSHYITFGLEF